jgi:general secretion pathway protein G
MTTRKLMNRAFSLLELLAVVVILGILAAAIVPRVVTSSQDARTSVHQHNLGEINAAVERYYIDEGSFPGDINDLEPDYLPDGVPAVPTDSSLEYILDANHRAATQSAS